MKEKFKYFLSGVVIQMLPSKQSLSSNPVAKIDESE